MVDLSWRPGDGQTLVVLLTAAVVFVAYHYGARAVVPRPRLDPTRAGASEVNSARAVHLRRLVGALLLGCVPALVVVAALPRRLSDCGLGAGDVGAAAAFVLAVAALTLPVVWAASRRPQFRTHYPEIRARSWNWRLYLANAATWTLYLVAYEFLFRGFLLFSLRDALGAWPAIGITTLAYVYAHLPKNAAETAATIPTGVVFAAGALATGAIWGPVAAHVLIANASDVLATRGSSALGARAAAGARTSADGGLEA